jgi:hypothetical protein
VNHVNIIKQALKMTWRYRPLWLFGFFLALCGGNGGGGGGGNFNFSNSFSGEDFGQFGEVPQPPSIEPGVVVALIIGIFCLVVLLAVVGVVIQVVTRTALIGMVRQISRTEAVTVADGWRIGWSRNAWRLFLVGLVIGIPWFVITITLLLLAFSPLVLLFAGDTTLTVIAIAATIVAFLFVLLILIILGVALTLLLDLARRRVVLEDQGVIATIGDTVGMIRRSFKDIILIWLLLLGAGFAWFFIALLIVLPVSLLAAAFVGIMPAVLVYLLTDSVVGAVIAGAPLALLTFILISTAAGGLYLIFRSAVWTLTYLEIRGLDGPETPAGDQPVDTGPASPELEPQLAS